MNIKLENTDRLTQAAELFCEGWNLLILLKKMEQQSSSSSEIKRIQNQLTRFQQRTGQILDDMGLEAWDLTGKIYAVEYPITALNIGDFGKDDVLYISLMKVPVIKKKDTPEIIKQGIVVLDKKETRE